ncbi:hypothetical protein PPYR_03803 [Photinus pyralis]|uniref:DNA-directed DNA polymerase n=1 Tax=Photinus pyralis TaxID=7054 RepID=A0A5N4AWB9_PHOPY|nr:hypothetical protein PPYR_03803 [Photinus pyralis]
MHLIRHKRHHCVNRNLNPHDEEKPSCSGVRKTKRCKIDSPSESSTNEEKPSCSGVTGAKRCKIDSPGESGSNNDNSNSGNNIFCKECLEYVPRRNYQGHLRSNKHKNNVCFAVDDGVHVIRCAFKNRLISYRMSPTETHVNVSDFMNDIKAKIVKVINDQLKRHNPLKINFELFGAYYLDTKNITDIKSFQSKYQVITISDPIEDLFQSLSEIVDRKNSEFQQKDSGWTLVQLLYLEINILKFNALRASSYIPLPPFISNKKAVLNIQNNDEYCFAYSLVAALFNPKGSPQLPSSYPNFRDVFNWNGVQFPVSMKQISTFEANNINISINVYGVEKILKDGTTSYEIVGPLYYSKLKKQHYINLLYISNDMGNQHYCLIKDFSKLVSKQLSNSNGKKIFCDACIHYFRTENALKRHTERDCNQVYTKLPSTNPKVDKTGNICPENILTFNNYHKQIRHPFVVYADFESMIVPIQTVEPNPLQSFSIQTQKHEPYSWCYYIKSTYNDEWSILRQYRGVDAATKFIDSLENDIKEIYHKHLKNQVPMQPLSKNEKKSYDDSTTCFICGNEFVSGSENVKVRDHCHVTGKYRGSAHSRCNLNFKLQNYIPIFFHNLSGYDSHLFIKHLGNKTDEINVLPLSTENYITFSKHLFVDEIEVNGKKEKKFINLRFLDSFKFLSSSLDVLSRNLADDQCSEIRKFFNCDEEFKLLRMKGCFPYSYVDCLEKLDEKNIPPYDQFYNIMRGENISLEEYDRVLNVYNVFHCKNLGEYSDIYLKCDVLLLADVFENFRDLCMKIYGLDSAHYFTAPGLTWDAMLKYSKVRLELLTDMDMYHFFKKGIRGGVSTCITRKSVANNEHLMDYDPQHLKSFIQYLDVTNLYGSAMREYLPHSGFTWLSETEIQNFNLFDVGDEDDLGYILEVDLQYPHVKEVMVDIQANESVNVVMADIQAIERVTPVITSASSTDIEINEIINDAYNNLITPVITNESSTDIEINEIINDAYNILMS